MDTTITEGPALKCMMYPETDYCRAYQYSSGHVAIMVRQEEETPDCTACVVLSLDNARKLRDYLNEVIGNE